MLINNRNSERLNKQLSEANEERKKQMKQLQQVDQWEILGFCTKEIISSLGHCRTRCARYSTRSSK